MIRKGIQGIDFRIRQRFQKERNVIVREISKSLPDPVTEAYPDAIVVKLQRRRVPGPWRPANDRAP
ncbi:hypothetical protein Sinac_6878 [Singulisphaera acidiphila DSM 18658]|uniref:Uncharacterized protein n=1 Tax=Singulisphaera acidiphila (strain ATCC BAA-1392 / DSM 18658 / VKM B-2454 / MOB10) TaxID=886293 RepID=L0DQ21_SINAD|nr:hypothetical protein Sinac_6878 [Singulisphaera acidiphila DSM 18658]